MIIKARTRRILIKNHINGEESQMEDSVRKEQSTVDTGLKECSLKMRNKQK